MASTGSLHVSTGKQNFVWRIHWDGLYPDRDAV